MAIFAVLQTESVVQVGDKTRLDARESFVTFDDEITKLEIKPTASSEWIDVTDDKYLDWAFTDEGEVVCEARVTSGAGEDAVQATGSAELSVLTAASDALFSKDADLLSMEPGIREFIPEGRSSFKNVHREAQTKIMDSLYRKGVRDSNGERLEKTAIVDVREVSEWSKYLVLSLICEGESNVVDDIFSRKAAKYLALAGQASNMAVIALDLNGDGEVDEETESVSIGSIVAVRR